MAKLESKHRVSLYGVETWFELEWDKKETVTELSVMIDRVGVRKVCHDLPWPLTLDDLHDLQGLLNERLKVVECAKEESDG